MDLMHMIPVMIFSNILPRPEVRYADKGYFGAETKGYDASMKRQRGPSFKL